MLGGSVAEPSCVALRERMTGTTIMAVEFDVSPTTPPPPALPAPQGRRPVPRSSR